MGKKFNAYVAVHKDPAETVWFAPGDDVPDWALELVGDHVYGGNHEADDSEDVRLTDPENEPDDPDTKWSTINTLPPTADAASDVDADSDLSYEDLTKDELKELCEQRELPVSGNKSELIARLEEDDENDDTE